TPRLGLPFLVMEFIDGETLSQRLAGKKPLEIAAAVEIVRQVALGLGAIHERGLIHRDVKPSNVLLDSSGRAKIADFGLAGLSDEKVALPHLTPGTPPYMSPEQFRGEPLDGRTDLYGLGIVLYQLLTGETPFRGQSPEVIRRQALQDDPVPPRRRNDLVS